MKKHVSEVVDENGKNVTNWVTSCYVYLLTSTALCFYRVGYVLLPVVVAMSLVFPIKGALEARGGLC